MSTSAAEGLTKRHMVGLRLDDEEIARLHRLAKHFGLNIQQVIRMLLKNEEDFIAGSKGKLR